MADYNETMRQVKEYEARRQKELADKKRRAELEKLNINPSAAKQFVEGFEAQFRFKRKPDQK